MSHSPPPPNVKMVCALSPKEDGRTYLLLNIASVAVGAALLLLGLRIRYIPLEFGLEGGLPSPLLLLLEAAGCLLLREALRWALLSLLGGWRARFVRTGLYPCASSQALLGKRAFALAALAPIALVGLLLLALCLLLPPPLFWPAYAVQIVNLASCTSDVYAVWRVLRLPPGGLVRDWGGVVELYAPQ